MTARESLGDRLAAENGLADDTAREIRRSEIGQAIERERSQARWLGRAALVAWGLALILIPTSAILGSIMQISIFEGGTGVPYLIPIVALGAFGSLALVVAIVTTIGWIYRSRTASLSAIEARLDELEAEVRRG
ncbi:MAG: hypothetical protein R3326_04840 [Gemmatimonadota bacterium]|nr:hypothetical protein [Gemmatimonadota bacterium]